MIKAPSFKSKEEFEKWWKKGVARGCSSVTVEAVIPPKKWWHL